MKSITLLILLISSLSLAFADDVPKWIPKWNTSCPFAANISTNTWQITNLTVSPTPPPADSIILTVCGVANQDFTPDQWNTTGIFIVSSPIFCRKGGPSFYMENILTKPNVTAGDEYCSDIRVLKGHKTADINTNWITTVILNDSQNRNLGCFTINDIVDKNLDKNCPASSALRDEISI